MPLPGVSTKTTRVGDYVHPPEPPCDWDADCVDPITKTIGFQVEVDGISNIYAIGNFCEAHATLAINRWETS